MNSKRATVLAVTIGAALVACSAPPGEDASSSVGQAASASSGGNTAGGGGPSYCLPDVHRFDIGDEASLPAIGPNFAWVELEGDQALGGIYGAYDLTSPDPLNHPNFGELTYVSPEQAIASHIGALICLSPRMPHGNAPPRDPGPPIIGPPRSYCIDPATWQNYLLSQVLWCQASRAASSSSSSSGGSSSGSSGSSSGGSSSGATHGSSSGGSSSSSSSSSGGHGHTQM